VIVSGHSDDRMHELSVALSLVEVVSEEMSRLGASRVSTVHLRVGILSGVAREALLFAFDAAVSGTPLEGARLEIEDVAAAIWCPACVAERTLASATTRRCPVCQTRVPELVRGEELDLVALQVMEHDDAHR
jgi:hydrogenase nickel incorporation protein HypA/HybF